MHIYLFKGLYQSQHKQEIIQIIETNCECDAYILVRGDINVTVSPQIQIVFKNCAPCTKCITKIDGTTTYNAESLYLVMPM